MKIVISYINKLRIAAFLIGVLIGVIVFPRLLPKQEPQIDPVTLDAADGSCDRKTFTTTDDIEESIRKGLIDGAIDSLNLKVPDLKRIDGLNKFDSFEQNRKELMDVLKASTALQCSIVVEIIREGDNTWRVEVKR